MARQYEPKDVLNDLLYLRKGPGFTFERFTGRPALIGILGGTSETPDVLRERLESAIHSLRDDDATLLMEVFGLAEETAGMTSLAVRRDVAARQLGLKREAVADRDGAATEKLFSQLITGWYPKSPTGIRVPESHNGFVQHAVHTRTYVRDGIHLETQRTHRLFALFDDVEYIGLSAAWPEPPVPVGGAFRVKTVPTANGYLHQFWHTEPMRRGETYELTYRIPNPDPEELGRLVEDSLAFHEPTRFASFEVVFIGAAPSTVWKFEGLTGLERPGAPKRGTVIQVGSGGSTRAQFRDLYGGLYCGIAWSWPG